MRIAKEILSVYLALIVLYLILVHSSGFARDIGSLAGGIGSTAKVFQGR